MILGPIAYVDCLVFLLFLAPSLLVQVGPYETLRCIIRTLPFLIFRMPFEFIRDHVFTPHHQRSPFVQAAPIFADIVIRCVRFAFASIPASIGAVFFSKWVALPFARFRMLRHGFLSSPIHCEEVRLPRAGGLWMVLDPTREPDVIVYYCHGGGFSMGSAYFYIEFLMAWLTLLHSRAGWSNPAVFALEYSLVPNETYPVQLVQALAGYEFAVSKTRDGDASKICIAGDSAGATIQMSLLLSMATTGAIDSPAKRPGFLTMISPWCKLVSPLHQNTASDYLNTESLHLYAREYVGEVVPTGGINSATGRGGVRADDPIASPGDCEDLTTWQSAAPRFGCHFIYGKQEVFAPEIKRLTEKLKKAGISTSCTEEGAGIHAWPVVALFLAKTKSERLDGLNKIVDAMSSAMKIK